MVSDKLKEIGTGHWTTNPNATNEIGFTGIPNSARLFMVDKYSFINMLNSGQFMLFWTSSENSALRADGLWLQGNANYPYIYDKQSGLSVRCIKTLK